jgi:GNAT superfamily N-acetyltransferase
MIQLRPLSREDMPTLQRLLACERMAEHCWCMWFIRRVKDFHADGAVGNKTAFLALAAASTLPLGLLAMEGEDPVGWVAVGPRSRYTRAITTPTLKATDRQEDDMVWLIPCLFVRPDRRGQGVTQTLLAGAVEFARTGGARAIEGFPCAERQRSGDRQVGTAALFGRAGFAATHHPSPNRVVMRLDLR